VGAGCDADAGQPTDPRLRNRRRADSMSAVDDGAAEALPNGQPPAGPSADAKRSGGSRTTSPRCVAFAFSFLVSHAHYLSAAAK
jgi:hypothetical protein